MSFDFQLQGLAVGLFSSLPLACPDQSQCECCIAAVYLPVNAVSNEQGCSAVPKQQHSGALLVGHSEKRGPTADVARSLHRRAQLRGRYRMREGSMLYCLSKCCAASRRWPAGMNGQR